MKITGTKLTVPVILDILDISDFSGDKH